MTDIKSNLNIKYFYRLLLSLLVIICVAQQFSSASNIEAKIISIQGPDLLSGRLVDLTPGTKGSVVVFMSARCPCSDSHVEILKKLSSEYKDFSFSVIHSNADEPIELSKAYFSKKNLPFKVIQDIDGKLADHYKALKTPHAYIVDPKGNILYRGGMTSSTNGETADKQFLKDALNDISLGQPVKVAEGRTLGCIISRNTQK
ncbi:MAG: redoxin domain-containing protein [Bdellovibrionales bacterium]